MRLTIAVTLCLISFAVSCEHDHYEHHHEHDCKNPCHHSLSHTHKQKKYRREHKTVKKCNENMKTTKIQRTTQKSTIRPTSLKQSNRSTSSAGASTVVPSIILEDTIVKTVAKLENLAIISLTSKRQLFTRNGSNIDSSAIYKNVIDFYKKEGVDNVDVTLKKIQDNTYSIEATLNYTTVVDPSKNDVNAAEDAQSKLNRIKQKFVKEASNELFSKSEKGISIDPVKYVDSIKTTKTHKIIRASYPCFDYDGGDYIYKLCPFDKVVQIDKANNVVFKLGKWRCWQPNEVWFYDKGEDCGEAPRSTEVTLTCGVQNKIISVTEPTVCKYDIRFETPNVCAGYVPYVIPTKKTINEACSTNDECSDQQKLVCSSNRCQCPSDNFFNYKTSICDASKDYQCFEYDGGDYIYKLCPFDKVVQVEKNNNAESYLGIWSSWKPDGVWFYDKGEDCGDTPRSTNVTLYCGLQNKIFSVTEPIACNYDIRFESPNVCAAIVPNLTKKKTINEICKTSDECSYEQKLVCSSNKCQCTVERYFNYKTSICETRKDSCVEYDDKEFIYKLCPFGSISKISKANQKSISLGIYYDGFFMYGSKLNFEFGDRCYSTEGAGQWLKITTYVTLSCGAQNKIISVTRGRSGCYYNIKFQTPIGCATTSAPTQQSIDEKCKTNAECLEQLGLVCSSNKCQCPIDKYFNYKTSICETRTNSCFEYDDKEFIYKLCLFGKISQISKTNQRSRNLGIYNYEDGSSLVYKGGTCSVFQAPPAKSWTDILNNMETFIHRKFSTFITLSCGAKDKIISAKPSLYCDFVIKFQTTLVC